MKRTEPLVHIRRVLITTDTLGGVWSYSVELCRALSARGLHVTLATMGPPMGAARARQLRDLRKVAVFESAFRLEWMEDPWTDVGAAGDWLLALAARERPDVIHLNGYAHAPLDWNAPTVVVAHSCVYSWWQAVKKQPPPPKYSEYYRRTVAGFRSADLVIAPSGAMLAEIARLYGSPADGVVIPNGRNASSFPRGAKLNMVFSTGRLWDEGKNIPALIRLASKLPWPVYLAGDVSGPDSQLHDLGGVNCLGHLSEAELAPWYSRAAIYVHPAKYEPFGLSVLEAALAGCALVLSDIPSLRENWDGAAVFASPDDSAALERAITGLMEDPGRRRINQARANARARRFSTTSMGGAYLDAYGRASVSFDRRGREGNLRRAS